MDTREVCAEAGVIEGADIRPDAIATVTKGPRRLVFGPCTRDAAGRVIEPDGWDVCYYTRDQDESGGVVWRAAGSEYLAADADMVMLASWYA